MKLHRLRAAAAVALVGLLGLAAGVALPAATAAAPTTPSTTEIRPATLDKGPAGLVPHVDGHALVVGERRYLFDEHEVQFLGMSGGDYVVGIYLQGRPRSHKVVRVTADDDRTVVLRGESVPELTLASDGEQVFRPTYRFERKNTVLRAWSSHDGTLVAARKVRGYAHVLDAFDGDAVVSASMPNRTFWWDLAADTARRITDRSGYEADVQLDRLAVLTGDPYQGGCSVVSTLTAPGERLWRSCRQAVQDFSPSGDRVVTTHLLADGLGPSEYQLRRTTGRLVHTYTAYYFGEALWESDDTLLLHAYGNQKNAWVRCDDAGACERTSRLRDTLL